jgi:hypothetical protein
VYDFSVVYAAHIFMAVVLFFCSIFTSAQVTLQPSIQLDSASTTRTANSQIDLSDVSAQGALVAVSSSKNATTPTVTYTPGVGTAYVENFSSQVFEPWIPLRSAMIGPTPCGNHSCGVGYWMNYYYYPPADGTGSSSLQYCFDNQCTSEPLSDLDTILVASTTEISKEGTGIYLNSSQFNHARLPVADPSTFNVLASPTGVGGVGIDKLHVYDDSGDVIPNLDPASFRELAEYDDAAGDQEFYSFSTDKNQVYFDGVSPLSPIAGADTASFVVGADGTYATDSRHTYCVGEPIALAGGGFEFPLRTFSGNHPSYCLPAWVTLAIRDNLF